LSGARMKRLNPRRRQSASRSMNQRRERQRASLPTKTRSLPLAALIH